MSTENSNSSETAWPILPSERQWNTKELWIVLMVAASATWCYIIGEYVGWYLGPKAGFAAMTAGAMIGMLLVVLAVVPTSTRYGVDSIVSATPQFGTNGWTITVFLQYASIIGWNSLLLIFFGKSITEFLSVTGLLGEMTADTVVPIATVAACAIVFFVLRNGASGVAKISKILFMFIIGVGAWMVYLLLTEKSAELAAAVPAYASGSFQWDYVTGIEIGVVSLLSWWPYIGAMTREAKDTSTAVVPSMLGMGLPVPLLSMVGLAAVLALGVSDPAKWMTELGGSFFGAIALLFVIAANLGTAVAGLYASAVGLKSTPFLANKSWNLALILAVVPVICIGVFVPDLFFNNFGTFLAYIGVFFAPLCAIQIVDFFFLRKGKLNVRAMYQNSKESDYGYWCGINPAAILAMAAGYFTYVYLLDPLTYVSHSPYEYLTASLPTAFVGGLTYYLLTILIVKPAGKGGY